MDNKMNHLTKTRPAGILDKHKFVIKFPRSRGDRRLGLTQRKPVNRVRAGMQQH